MTNERTGLDAPPRGSAEPRRADAGTKTEQAKEVAGRTADRAGDVAGEVGAQAKVVARDAKEQARRLVDQGRQHLDDEARARSRQAAGGLRTIADQLGALSDGADERAGALGDYARQGRAQLSRLADRLDDGPAAVLDDVRRFARRQPVVFLAAAGAVGFVVGRLVRGARDASQADGSDGRFPAPVGNGRTGELPTPSALTPAAPTCLDRAVPTAASHPGAGRGPDAVSAPQEAARPTEPKRPEASLGELFTEMTTELSGLFRQEVELAKVETREELSRTGKAAGSLGGGVVAALLAITFLSVALALLLAQALNDALSFAIVAVGWAIAAAVLVSAGRRKLREVRPLPETTTSIKEDVQWVKDLKS